MSNSKIPSTTNVDMRSTTNLPTYQSEAPQILSTPQYCMQPLPVITQPQGMSTEGQQVTTAIEMSFPAPSYSVNMDPQFQFQGTGDQVTAPGYPTSALGMPAIAPPYTENTEGQFQYQQAGWNQAVLPPPPPYSTAGHQPHLVYLPEAFLKTDLRDIPGQTVCPSCNLPCMTQIEHISGCLTTLLCCLLFFFGCLLGCCLIPLCVNSCKDVNHYCPYCKHLIHKYKRL
ncbi:lipopolysaccharide-induced tumor necrosis factor-alpha factor homolog isoform X1 [Pseudophryne corroboree]|uniref:lipopolysaccharide-induced tumor necrosis factor-alpha factor homolog isoform X1 n=1 Tax=Pseudophryne corroboree TaxID=495146 RepID=UPI0030818E52